MMAQDMIGRAARDGRARGVAALYNDGAQALAWSAALDEVAALLERDPDAAALALEGALRALVEEWYARQGLVAPEPRHLLADLEARDEPLAWRLRLALRAPHVAARLAHARGLEGVLFASRPLSLRRRAEPEAAR